VKSGHKNLQRVHSPVYVVVMMRLGCSDVSSQVFPRVQSISSIIAMRKDPISVAIFGLNRRRCWRAVGSIVYKQLHSVDRSALLVMNRTATEPSCRTVALSHTAKHTALCSPGRTVAHSVWRCVSDRSCAECKWRVAVRTRTLVAGTLDPAICPSVVVLRAVSKLPAHSGAVRLRSG
jgi:hypothetical protein